MNPLRFVLAYSIPYDYNWASNWFGLKFVGLNDKIDKEMYNYVYDHEFWTTKESTADVSYKQVFM